MPEGVEVPQPEPKQPAHAPDAPASNPAGREHAAKQDQQSDDLTEFQKKWSEVKKITEPDQKKKAMRDLGMPDEHIDDILFIDGKIGENKILSNEIVNDIVQRCVVSDPPLRSEELAVHIDLLYPQLDERDKKKLLALLRAVEPAPREEDDEELPDEEKEKAQISQKEMEEQVKTWEETLGEVNTDGMDPKKKKQVEAAQGKIDRLSKKLHEFFHPDDPRRTWARRGGKMMYYILLGAFVGLILELHAIHKMAGQRASR